MDYETDEGAGGGCRLGLIVLSTDETLEYEARQLLGTRAVNLLHACIPAQADVTHDDLATMAGDMTGTVARLPTRLRAVAYGCTLGATVIGPERVRALVQKARPDVPETSPMSLVISAVEANLGRPVIRSTQTLMWHLWPLGDGDARGWGPRRLFAARHAGVLA
jgi:maleate isomerase